MMKEVGSQPGYQSPLEECAQLLEDRTRPKPHPMYLLGKTGCNICWRIQSIPELWQMCQVMKAALDITKSGEWLVQTHPTSSTRSPTKGWSGSWLKIGGSQAGGVAPMESQIHLAKWMPIAHTLHSLPNYD